MKKSTNLLWGVLFSLFALFSVQSVSAQAFLQIMKNGDFMSVTSNGGTLDLGNTEIIPGMSFGAFTTPPSTLSPFIKIAGDQLSGDYTITYTHTSPAVKYSELQRESNPLKPIPAATLMNSGYVFQIFHTLNADEYIESVGTLDVKDAAGTLVFTATVKFSAGTKPAANPAVFTVSDATKSYANNEMVELGDVNISTGTYTIPTKFTIKGENVTDNMRIRPNPSGNFDVDLVDANGNVLFKGNRNNTITKEDLTAGKDFYVRIKMYDPSTANLVDPQSVAFLLRPATTTDDVYKVQFNFKFVKPAAVFNINDVIEQGGVLDLGNVPSKSLTPGFQNKLTGTTEVFTIKAQNASGNYTPEIVDIQPVGILTANPMLKDKDNIMTVTDLTDTDLNGAGVAVKLAFTLANTTVEYTDFTCFLKVKDAASSEVFNVAVKFSVGERPASYSIVNAVAGQTFDLGNVPASALTDVTGANPAQKNGATAEFTVKGENIDVADNYTIEVVDLAQTAVLSALQLKDATGVVAALTGEQLTAGAAMKVDFNVPASAEYTEVNANIILKKDGVTEPVLTQAIKFTIGTLKPVITTAIVDINNEGKEPLIQDKGIIDLGHVAATESFNNNNTGKTGIIRVNGANISESETYGMFLTNFTPADPVISGSMRAGAYAQEVKVLDVTKALTNGGARFYIELVWPTMEYTEYTADFRIDDAQGVSIYTAQVKFALGTKPEPVFDINAAANNGTLDLGNIAMANEAISNALTLKGTKLFDPEYTIEISNTDNTRGTLAIVDEAGAAVTTITKADAEAGKVLKVKATGVTAYTEFAETITVKLNGRVVYTVNITLSVGEKPLPTSYSIDFAGNTVDNNGTLVLGNMQVAAGVAKSAAFTIKGISVPEGNYTLAISNQHAEYKLSLVDDKDAAIASLDKATLEAGKAINVKFEGTPAADVEYTATLSLAGADGNPVYLATVTFTIKHEEVVIPAPVFAINETIADNGTLTLAKVEHDNGMGISEAFTLKGTNVATGDYTLDFTQNSVAGQGSLELCDAAENPLFIPGNPKTGTDADATPIAAETLMAGQQIKVKFTGNPNIALTEVSETLTLVDASKKVLYTATVKFTLDKVVVIPEPSFAINETIADNGTLALGDMQVADGVAKSTAFTLKGANVVDGNYNVAIASDNKEYKLSLVDDKDAAITALDKAALEAGKAINVKFEGAPTADVEYNATFTLTDAEGKAVYTATITFTIKHEVVIPAPSFAINETIADKGTLALGDMQVTKGVAKSTAFTLKGANVVDGNYNVAIASDNKEYKLSLVDDKDAAITALDKAALEAGKAINVKFEGAPAADVEYNTTFTLTDAEGKAVYTATITFTIKHEVKSAVDNISLNGKIWSEQGAVCIEAEEAAQVVVFTIDGKYITNRMIDAGVNRIELPEGMYIINLNGASAKAVVR